MFPCCYAVRLSQDTSTVGWNSWKIGENRHRMTPYFPRLSHWRKNRVSESDTIWRSSNWIRTCTCSSDFWTTPNFCLGISGLQVTFTDELHSLDFKKFLESVQTSALTYNQPYLYFDPVPWPRVVRLLIPADTFWYLAISMATSGNIHTRSVLGRAPFKLLRLLNIIGQKLAT